MRKRFSSKKKAISAVMSVMLVATAFNPGGCFLKVDEATMQQLLGLIGDMSTRGEFDVNGSWGGEPIGPGGPGGEEGGGECHGSWEVCDGNSEEVGDD